MSTEQEPLLSPAQHTKPVPVGFSEDMVMKGKAGHSQDSGFLAQRLQKVTAMGGSSVFKVIPAPGRSDTGF